ncbi:MAG: hypothetical protein WBR18_09840 [Anaerolineales bacterium]
MKRFGIIALVLFGLGLGACGQLLAGPLGEPGQVVTVVGRIESVDASPMAYDGPAVIELSTEEHGRVQVYVSPCMGPCVLDAVDSLGRMTAGQTWQVTGEASADGDLMVYNDAAHSLRSKNE